MYKRQAYIFGEVHPILETFHDELCKKIIKEIPTLLAEHTLLTPQIFLIHPDKEISQIAINLNADRYSYANWKGRGIELQTQMMPEENFLKDSINAILRLKSKKLIGILDENRKAIEELSKTNSPELAIKLKVYQKLKEDLSVINKILGAVVLKPK